MAISFCSAGKSVFFASDSLDKVRKKRKKNECRASAAPARRRASPAIVWTRPAKKEKKMSVKQTSVEHPQCSSPAIVWTKARKKRKKKKKR